MTDITIERVREGDLAEILRNYERFWGDGDILRYLHHPIFFVEFADTGFVARTTGGEIAGEIAGYLLGFVAPTGDGYIHFIAVRDDARSHGIARALYGRFTEVAIERGAVGLKAITSPENQASQAFHRNLGFTEMTTFEDYLGTGRARIVMRKALV
jgi:ribosomal protein S18 acetylase RimI-like enzyme